ncbi:protein PNS1-like [Rosa sericea]
MRLFTFLFSLHLVLIALLIIFLTVYGLISTNHKHHFHPLKFYAPLLTSTLCSAIVALIWQWVTRLSPSKAIKTAFWLSPLLTCAVGVLLISISSAGSLAAGGVAIICALIQSLYACWVSPRIEFAIRILSVSTAVPPPKITTLLVLSIFTCILYLSFLVSGIGGATAIRSRFGVLFISVILLSMAWTMHLIKNLLQVTISRIKYTHFACGEDVDTSEAFCSTLKHSMGSICIGSILVPVLGVIRGSARGMKLVAGDTNEFLFSCANCYSGLASTLVMYGNRWGFVHVGVYNKGFVQASADTWEMFRNIELKEIIDLDLTTSFCFLSGVVGGAISSLVSGTWTLVIHKSYATEVSLYAFLIGYFMCRIAMAWPQACVSSYYVAYAENPNSTRFDSTIPVRIEELQRFQA